MELHRSLRQFIRDLHRNGGSPILSDALVVVSVRRMAVPMQDAFHAVCAANTIDSYTRFREVWPTFSEYVEDRIRALKYPRLKKWTSRLGWLVLGAIALIFALFVVLSIVPW